MKKQSIKTGWRRWWSRRRGQAMVSYALLTAFLLGSAFILSIKMLPAMLEAYNAFTKSMYFGISMPIP